MAKSKLAWPQSDEEKRLADTAYRDTIAALDRFNKLMLEAGYKVKRGLAAEVDSAAKVTAKKVKKAA